MTGAETVFKYAVKRMLYTGEALCRIIIFVVDVEITVFHGFSCFLRKKIIVDKRLCRFACELHHHSGRGVGVHVGILARDVIVLGFDDLKEHIACLGTACDATLIAIGDITLGHFLARAFHQFYLHAILNLLYGHALFSGHAYTIDNLMDQSLVLSHFGLKHGLAYGCHYFFFVISHDAAVALYHDLYHFIGLFLVFHLMLQKYLFLQEQTIFLD